MLKYVYLPAAALKFPLNSDIVSRRLASSRPGARSRLNVIHSRGKRPVTRAATRSVPGRHDPRDSPGEPVTPFLKPRTRTFDRASVIEPLIAKVVEGGGGARGVSFYERLFGAFREQAPPLQPLLFSTVLFAKRTMHGKSNSLKRRILIAPRRIAVISVKRPALRHPSSSLVRLLAAVNPGNSYSRVASAPASRATGYSLPRKGISRMQTIPSRSIDFARYFSLRNRCSQLSLIATAKLRSMLVRVATCDESCEASYAKIMANYFCYFFR